MTPVDFGRHSDDYATSLDLGTGPGTTAFELAARGSAVTGIDTSLEQIATACRVAVERELDHATDFRVAPAEAQGLERGVAPGSSDAA